MNNKFPKIYFGLLFILLAIISYHAFFYPPMSDYWQMFYFFHHLNDLPKISNLPQWLHVANLDPVEQMRYQPLSHFFYFTLHLLFGSNYVFYNIVNFLFYFLSLILFYRFALIFSNQKYLVAAFVGLFAVLFNHFDIVLWSCHIYVIAGFCMFMAGFINYVKFLKTGKSFLIFWITILFILGMFCYESFFLWPLGIIFLSYMKNLKAEKVDRNKITKMLWLTLGVIYSTYFLFFLFTRSLGTYVNPSYQLSDFLQLNKFILSGVIILFNVLYNNIVIAIYPLLAFPLKVTENVYLGGAVIDHIKTNPEIVFIGGGVIGVGVIFSAIYLYWKKSFEKIKVFAFISFLMFSYIYIITFCRLGHDSRIECTLTEFRYQYIPNAMFILIILLVLNGFFKFSKNRRRMLYSIFGILAILNIYCIRKLINIYDVQLFNLKKMFSNIKTGINNSCINENAPLYINDTIYDYLPSLCWNIEMGERFIKGTYQWIFSKKKMKCFSNNLKDAEWVINKENFKIIKKSSKVQFDKARIISAGKDEQYINLGDFYKGQKAYKKAEEVFKKAININPQNVPAYYELVACYKEQAEYEKIKETFKKAIEMNPENDVIYVDLGNFYNRQEKYQEAEEMFKKAIVLNRENQSAYDGLITSYRNRLQYQKVEDVFKEAIEMNPKNDVIYADLGHFYNGLEKYKEAKAMFDKAIVLNPKNQSAYDGLSICYKNQGRYDEAEEIFRKGIKINPKNDVIYADLGHFYNELERYREAEEMFKKAIKINPNNGSAYYGLMVCYRNQMQYKEAEEVSKKAINTNPRNDIIYTELGHLYNVQGRYKEAETMFKKALEINPNGNMAYDGLKECYKKQGRDEKK